MAYVFPKCILGDRGKRRGMVSSLWIYLKCMSRSWIPAVCIFRVPAVSRISRKCKESATHRPSSASRGTVSLVGPSGRELAASAPSAKWSRTESEAPSTHQEHSVRKASKKDGIGRTALGQKSDSEHLQESRSQQDIAKMQGKCGLQHVEELDF
ncbi:hypothetical protein B0H11DRAFT_1907345 [Mycena galericulata]|nr:hypothetical protein B0H11DRAFT_1907345 [Mycena galericulata]